MVLSPPMEQLLVSAHFLKKKSDIFDVESRFLRPLVDEVDGMAVNVRAFFAHVCPLARG
jgi:hypothetical protein